MVRLACTTRNLHKFSESRVVRDSMDAERVVIRRGLPFATSLNDICFSCSCRRLPDLTFVCREVTRDLYIDLYLAAKIRDESKLNEYYLGWWYYCLASEM
jgi:hypothetical protein